jgi:hypothetical protein
MVSVAGLSATPSDQFNNAMSFGILGGAMLLVTANHQHLCPGFTAPTPICVGWTLLFMRWRRNQHEG